MKISILIVVVVLLSGCASTSLKNYEDSINKPKINTPNITNS